MEKIVHYSAYGPMLCDPNLRRNRGRLATNRWAHEADYHYTTAEHTLTCQACIQKRIDYHLIQAGKLEERRKILKRLER